MLPQRSYSSCCVALLVAPCRAATEEPFYRASPEERIIILATEQPLIALPRRSP